MTVGGVEVFVRHTPGGPDAEPALYIHGLGGASTNWTDLAAQLAPWLDGDALDLPGFGRSGPSLDGRYSMQAYADVVIGLLEQRGRGAVHLLANSMGGAIAILVASARPDLVQTMTLISPAVPARRLQRPHTNPVLLLVAVPGIGRLIMRYFDRQSPEQRARGIARVCFADPSCIPPHRLAEAADEIRARKGQSWAGAAFVRSLRGLLRSYLMTGERTLWARMRTIKAPTLLVWGDSDRLVDPALAPQVAATIPDAQLLVLPGVGHVAQIEHPTETARAVLGLLERSRPAG